MTTITYMMYNWKVNIMYRVIAISLIFLFGAMAESARAKDFKASPDIQSWCDQIVGNEFWLKTEVIRVQGNYKATDATNVFPDGRVYHQGTISKGVQISAQTPSEFTDEARRKLGFDKAQNAATILTMDRGARVYIHEVEANKKQVKVKLTLKGSWYSTIKSTIRLKLDAGYTLDDVKESFDVAFAAEEHEIKHASKTDEIGAGMSMDQVIKVFGYANKKITLATKTLLVYDNLVLIFKDDKLSDVD
jgi:hypothetical protein